MKFEYQVITPYIKDGKFVDGHTNEQEKGLFGQEKTVYKPILITEETWLNRKGELGWELVNVLRNSVNYDIREYYFKRKVTV